MHIYNKKKREEKDGAAMERKTLQQKSIELKNENYKITAQESRNKKGKQCNQYTLQMKPDLKSLLAGIGERE